MKSIQLVDLLNDLEKEEEINKRIKEHLKNANDRIMPFPSNNRNGWPSSLLIFSSGDMSRGTTF